MKRFAFILALLAWPCLGQDTPPVPTPSLTIEGPTEGKRDDYNDFKAVGGPEKGTYQWLVLPLNANLNLRESDGGKSITVVGLPGSYTLLLFVSDGTAKQLDQHEFVIPGDVDPPKPDDPDPPKPKSLRELAGAEIESVERMYVGMLEALGLPPPNEIASVEQFAKVHTAAIANRKLELNLAVIQCLKRLNLTTLDAVKAELGKICEELKTAPVSTATNLTYVYEKDDGEPTASVGAGIDRVNRQTKIRAMSFEEDLPPPNDIIKASIEAARQAGLPAIVLTNGRNVLRVVKNPTTADQVWGAAQ